jgi:hypothetical protein
MRQIMEAISEKRMPPFPYRFTHPKMGDDMNGVLAWLDAESSKLCRISRVKMLPDCAWAKNNER